MVQAKNLKVCPVCGTRFAASPSSKKVTCSPECSTINKRRTHRGVSNTWSDAARAQLSERGQTENLKKGTAAAMLSPNSGKGEANVSAKHWVIKSPDNVLYEFDNLVEFIRQHPEDFPNAKSAQTALQSSKWGRYKDWQVVYRSDRINKYNRRTEQ